MSGVLLMPMGPAPILIDRSLVSNVPNTENALVQVTLTPFGLLQTTEGGGGGVVTGRLPEWWGHTFTSGFDIGEGFQASCFVVSGAAPNSTSDPVSSWIDMNGASIRWLLFRNSVGVSMGVWDVSIRSKGTGNVLAVGRFNVTSTKNP
jgi:hypothetical protein